LEKKIVKIYSLIYFMNIDKVWKEKLNIEFQSYYFNKIESFLLEEKNKWKIVYPNWDDVFNAFKFTPFDDVKVVILWQDPYHWFWQSHGLCFSVKKWIAIPPSLKNIFKELHDDLWIEISNHWFLEKWSRQWVFLLNTVLTVEANKPWSHKSIGWNQFTDRVIQILSNEKTWLVFLLWWSFAQSKKKFIDQKKHFILEASHPSPLSSYRGFFGCKHFSKTNKILFDNWKNVIDWGLS